VFVYLAGKNLWATLNENLIVERLAPGALVGDGVLQLPLYLKIEDVILTMQFFLVQVCRKTSTNMQAVLGIRIRMILGIPDLDPLVTGTDPDPSLFS
jgi:hypothetical protein